MGKILHMVLPALIASICMQCYSQKPIVVEQQVEYLWMKNSFFDDPSIIKTIEPSFEFVDRIVNNSFAKAFENRWGITPDKASISIKPFTMFSFKPKLKTKLNTKDPGKWYLFLQIIDRWNNVDDMHEMAKPLVLELKCLIIDGKNDSIILKRDMKVHIKREEAPSDQIIIMGLPAFPQHLEKAFDHMAAWLYQKDPVDQQSLTLKPACLFFPFTKLNEPMGHITFKSNTRIPRSHELNFIRSGPKIERMGSNRNTGGNLGNKAFTLLTGISGTKTRTFHYKADYMFDNGEHSYICSVNFYEQEQAEIRRERTNNNGNKSPNLISDNFRFAGRYLDQTKTNFITAGNDTLAAFHIRYFPGNVHNKKYALMWDGSDSTTLAVLPPELYSNFSKPDIKIEGTINQTPFTMNTKNEIRDKEFYIDDELAVIIYGKNEPVRASYFMNVSPMHMKLFTIMASLPFDYLITK